MLYAQTRPQGSFLADFYSTQYTTSPGACMPDTLESRRTKRSAQGYGGRATKASPSGSAEYHLPDYTEPEPKRRPARPRRKVKLRETT